MIETLNSLITPSEVIAFFMGGLVVWIMLSLRSSGDSTPIEFQHRVSRTAMQNLATDQAVQVKTRTKEQFIVNGITYNSLDDVPEPFRQQIQESLKDENKDGVPDIFEK